MTTTESYYRIRVECPVCKRRICITKNCTFGSHKSQGKLCAAYGQSVPQELIDMEKDRIERVKKQREEHRCEIRKARQSKEWRDKRKELLGECCELCGSKEILALHHFDNDSYRDIKTYKTLADKKVVTLCKRCHFALHHGMDICPKCKKKYKQFRFPTCYGCAHPEANTKGISVDMKLNVAL